MTACLVRSHCRVAGCRMGLCVFLFFFFLSFFFLAFPTNLTAGAQSSTRSSPIYKFILRTFSRGLWLCVFFKSAMGLIVAGHSQLRDPMFQSAFFGGSRLHLRLASGHASIPA